MKVRATSAVQEFACHSKACAPPPAGHGGSTPGTGGGGSQQEPKSFFNPGGKSEYWTKADSHLQAKIHHEQQTKHNATDPEAIARQRRTEKPVKINGKWFVKTTQWPLGG